MSQTLEAQFKRLPTYEQIRVVVCAALSAAHDRGMNSHQFADLTHVASELIQTYAVLEFGRQSTHDGQSLRAPDLYPMIAHDLSQLICKAIVEAASLRKRFDNLTEVLFKELASAPRH